MILKPKTAEECLRLIEELMSTYKKLKAEKLINERKYTDGLKEQGFQVGSVVKIQDMPRENFQGNCTIIKFKKKFVVVENENKEKLSFSGYKITEATQ